MKTNRRARRLARASGILMCVTVVGLAGISFRLSEVLISRIPQIAAQPAAASQGTPANFADLMSVAQ